MIDDPLDGLAQIFFVNELHHWIETHHGGNAPLAQVAADHRMRVIPEHIHGPEHTRPDLWVSPEEGRDQCVDFDAVADLRIGPARGKRGLLVQAVGVLRKGAVHVTAREHDQAFHAVADAVIEQLLGARHVDVVPLALIGAKVLDETHVNHAGGPFPADHVFEFLLSQVDHIGANSPRVPLPSDPIDTTNLETLLEAAGQEPPLTSRNSRDQ